MKLINKIFIIVMIIFLLLALVLSVVIIGFTRTRNIQKDQRQQIFLKGTFPDPLPDGFYNGIFGRKVSWQGKTFNSQNANGINQFNGVQKYPFKTYRGKGLTDKDLDVLKIDYDIKGNPFWLRFVLDEIVQVEKDQYLGKMHFRIIPGAPFSIAYFWLKK